MFKAWGIGCDSNSFLTAIFCSRAALGRLGRGQIGTPEFSEYINWVENARKIRWKYVENCLPKQQPQAKKRNHDLTIPVPWQSGAHVFKVSSSLKTCLVQGVSCAPEASGHCWWLRIVTFATLGWSRWILVKNRLNRRLSVHIRNAVSKFGNDVKGYWVYYIS